MEREELDRKLKLLPMLPLDERGPIETDILAAFDALREERDMLEERAGEASEEVERLQEELRLAAMKPYPECAALPECPQPDECHYFDPDYDPESGEHCTRKLDDLDNTV